MKLWLTLLIAPRRCSLDNDGGRLRTRDLVNLGDRARGVLCGGVGAAGQGFHCDGSVAGEGAVLMHPGRAAADHRCRSDRERQAGRAATGLTT